jgi:hypothetical protein
MIIQLRNCDLKGNLLFGLENETGPFHEHKLYDGNFEFNEEAIGEYLLNSLQNIVNILP